MYEQKSLHTSCCSELVGRNNNDVTSSAAMNNCIDSEELHTTPSSQKPHSVPYSEQCQYQNKEREEGMRVNMEESSWPSRINTSSSRSVIEIQNTQKSAKCDTLSHNLEWTEPVCPAPIFSHTTNTDKLNSSHFSFACSNHSKQESRFVRNINDSDSNSNNDNDINKNIHSNVENSTYCPHHHHCCCSYCYSASKSNNTKPFSSSSVIVSANNNPTRSIPIHEELIHDNSTNSSPSINIDDDQVRLESTTLTISKKEPIGYVQSSEQMSCTSSEPQSQCMFHEKRLLLSWCCEKCRRCGEWVQSIFRTFIPYGGLVSNCFSLSSVTLGGGIISMPSSFAMSGVAMSIIYLIVIGAMTVYTMVVMGYVMEQTHCTSFEETATLLASKKWGHFVGFVLWISCVGAAIAYISAASSLITPILTLSPHCPAFLQTHNGIRCITACIWLCCMLPVVLPKRVNTIRYISAIGCTMVVYFVLVIVVHSCTNGMRRGMREDMQYVTHGNKALYGLSIFSFAYLCQAMSQPVYFEMKPRPSIRQLTLASVIAMTACTVLYICAGLFGYLDFANSTRDSILYNFDPVHQPYVMVAYVGMLIKIIAAYGVNMIPCRNVMYHVLGWNLDTLSYGKHFMVVIGMSTVVLLCGLFIPSVNTAFGLVGSLCGGFTGFIFPALLWMYCGNWSLQHVGIWHYLATYLLLIAGVIAIVFGTIATVYQSFVDTNTWS